jgi:hypothetical protein
MSDYPIDIDAETVFFDNSWYTREDLARRIKAMIDEGDFQVAKPSTALEYLTAHLKDIRTLAFRCTPQLGDALNAAAKASGRTVGQLIRDALVHAIESGAASKPPAHQPPAPKVESGSPTVQVSPEVVAGPGALQSAGLDPAQGQPVELKNPKKKDDEQAAAERSWFRS